MSRMCKDVPPLRRLKRTLRERWFGWKLASLVCLVVAATHARILFKACQTFCDNPGQIPSDYARLTRVSRLRQRWFRRQRCRLSRTWVWVKPISQLMTHCDHCEARTNEPHGVTLSLHMQRFCSDDIEPFKLCHMHIWHILCRCGFRFGYRCGRMGLITITAKVWQCSQICITANPVSSHPSILTHPNALQTHTHTHTVTFILCGGETTWRHRPACRLSLPWNWPGSTVDPVIQWWMCELWKRNFAVHASKWRHCRTPENPRRE